MWEIGLNPQPTAQPLDTDEVIAALRLSADEAAAQATVIATGIAGARTACESFIGRPLIKRTVELWGESWTDCEGIRVYRHGKLWLPMRGVSLINSIKYLDPDGAEQTWSNTTGWDKILPSGDFAGQARIFRRLGQSFPVARCQPASIKINYDTGYGTASTSVPARLREGMLLYVGEAYKNREVSTSGTIITENPVSAERAWWPFRVF